MKPIIAVFEIPGMTSLQYDNVIADLTNAGAGQPEARRHHFAAQSPSGWTVVDIWDSPESLNQFAGTLIPLLIKNGVSPTEPRVFPLHNEIN